MTHDPLFSVADKVVIVTGGSRGLGRAMCEGFAARGAHVVVASRKLDACEALVADLRASGGSASAVACHVGHWDELPRVIEHAVTTYGRLDVLINNAGMSPLAPSLLGTTEELVDKVLDVNLKGPLRLTALGAEAMRTTGGGSVVNISSVAAVRPNPFTTAYAAAKAALNAVTVASAQEYAALDVRVNAIMCGTFDTDATSGFVHDEALLGDLLKVIAMARVGRADEIVGTALYLASEASSYVTGSLVTVDGGVI